MQNKSVLYISDVNPAEPIFHSQVLPHVIKLREYSKVLLIILMRNNEDKSLIDKSFSYTSIPGDYSQIISRLNFLRQHKKLKEYFCKEEIDIIYSRGTRGGLVGVFLKYYFFDHSVPLINDVRGDILDENKDSFLKLKVLDTANKLVFKNADLLFCVSTFLKKKICYRYNMDQNKAFVFPTFVPDEKFRFNQQNRLKIRKNLGYTDTDIVIIYSGNLASWQNIDTILHSFSNTTNKYLNLLVLTKDKGIKEKFSQFNLNVTKITHLNVDYSEIEQYYHAGDFGILIRDNTDTNKSAAPTKFSEYVNAGLSLIINELEADYVQIFKKQNLKGFLLKDKYELTKCLNCIEHSMRERNSVKINTLSDIVLRQVEIFDT